MLQYFLVTSASYIRNSYVLTYLESFLLCKKDLPASFSSLMLKSMLWPIRASRLAVMSIGALARMAVVQRRADINHAICTWREASERSDIGKEGYCNNVHCPQRISEKAGMKVCSQVNLCNPICKHLREWAEAISISKALKRYHIPFYQMAEETLLGSLAIVAKALGIVLYVWIIWDLRGSCLYVWSRCLWEYKQARFFGILRLPAKHYGRRIVQ